MEYICDFVPSLRGGAKLRVHGYLYVKDKCRGDKYYWCCESRKSLYCNARAVTRAVDGKHVLMSSSEHNHLPKPSRAGASTAAAEVKVRVNKTRDLPRKSIQSRTTSAPTSVAPRLPIADALRQTLNRIRRAQRPAEPMALAEVDVSSLLENTLGGGRFVMGLYRLPDS
ncbi:FLYWCH zinc finger domain protein [Trichuris suis]|nr:FLYWCH zinc finger domain protein [Trichuris suis]